MSHQSILRITREVSEIEKGNDLSLAIAYKESDIRNIKALIVGPPGTPYEFGFFEFSVNFPEDYPGNPPKVTALTTNSGRCRFNPNIYAGGKVCLTWPGKEGEGWSSAQCLESVLISIQSLMSSNPYENEPGYEDANSNEDRQAMTDYVAKIKHETLRIAVIQPLEESLNISKTMPGVDDADKMKDDSDDANNAEKEKSKRRQSFQPFDDLRKRRFLWYYESYMHTIDVESEKVKLNDPFREMRFEYRLNTMRGCFNYPDLKERLIRIRDEIMKETQRWAIEGLKTKTDDLCIASNLSTQLQQIMGDFEEQKNSSLHLSLVDDNPFVWGITYFGCPSTHLDGGVFNIKIHISPRFPQEQPRIFFEKPIFHHHVSKGGMLCYHTNRPGELKCHIEAVVQTIEEESPPFDPRTTVNLEASRLFWGTPEDRKKYIRALRRSLEDSTS
ncbi:ubiquitin conjugating enzyme, putative [Talaromyces stipitatus ATCC 10500]|uniref:Ubiquitin conjugating enzyme, putative n=1 Tax=Talaromyces stipitatus (strain ATCC 10500 / CBS 375.48 / QM 6759 / NRRL 1006) TaxID=441959 RepID=B8MQ91_TALSN|nr:ubiquitin conjugating enzyme, putative [Talaromyces stipitatus ATCC 10500]EED13238.1 ubiquitin conjugating enzyme, putative [Talaromyces stipitatus ATCC 10500]